MFSDSIRELGVSFESVRGVSVGLERRESFDLRELNDVSIILTLRKDDTVIAIDTETYEEFTFRDGLILANQLNPNPKCISLRLEGSQTIQRNGNRRLWYASFDNINAIKDVIDWVLKETNIPI